MVASLLLVRLSAIGDVVHGLPALEVVRAALPGARIGWAVEAEAAPLLCAHPALDRLHVLDRRALGRDRGRASAVVAARDFVRELRGEQYEAAVDLQGLARSAVVARLASRATFGPAHAREMATLAYRTKLAVPRPAEAHAVERSLALVRGALAALGSPAPAGTPAARLALAPAAHDAAARALGPLARQPFVALLPGAGKEANRPPVELLAASLRRAREGGAGLAAVILGGRGDRERARELARRTGALDLTGQLALDETAAVLARARAVLGGDTGPLHVARAVGTPVVSLFFAADPARTGPGGLPGEARASVLEGSADCAPCCARRCARPGRERVCLEPLTPRRIAAALLEAAGELARA